MSGIVALHICSVARNEDDRNEDDICGVDKRSASTKPTAINRIAHRLVEGGADISHNHFVGATMGEDQGLLELFMADYQ